MVSPMNSIDEIVKTANKYKVLALEVRKEFTRLRFKQDDDIRELYFHITKNIARELKKSGLSKFDRKKLNKILKVVDRETDTLNKELVKNFNKYLKLNIDTSSIYSKSILAKATEDAGIARLSKDIIYKMFEDSSYRTLKAYYDKTKDGLLLSDTIWLKSQQYRDTIKSILQASILEGKDCVKVAKSLETYVKKGRKTFVDKYPNMINRIGNRVPQKLNYEALRLARTEMTAAYGAGVLASANISPASQALKFMLSIVHPKTDICDEICLCDDFGLGKGVYPINEAPAYPFHPNCLCIVMTVELQPEELVQRLLRWNSDPWTEPSIEYWYQDVYLNYIE